VQVYELHRLYRIQRQLMGDLGRGQLASTRRRSKQPRRSLNLQLPADEYIVCTDDEDKEAELALGGGRSTTARRRSSRQEHNTGGGSGGSPYASDSSGASLLSSSPSSVEYYSDDGTEVVHAPPCQRATMAFDLGEGVMRQQQAPWLMQCHQYPSLRMT
jgi:hypothetical protein